MRLRVRGTIHSIAPNPTVLLRALPVQVPLHPGERGTGEGGGGEAKCLSALRGGDMIHAPNIFCPHCGAPVSIDHIAYLWKIVPSIEGWVSCCLECAELIGKMNYASLLHRLNGGVYEWFTPIEPEFSIGIRKISFGSKVIFKSSKVIEKRVD